MKAVVFDVGETLVDETRSWERLADAVGVPRFTLMGVLGGLIARGRPHHEVWSVLGAEPPVAGWRPDAGEFYPDALPAIEALRAAVGSEYRARTRLTPMVLPVRAADGAGRLR